MASVIFWNPPGYPPYVHVKPKVRYSTSRRSGQCHRITRAVAHVVDGQVRYSSDWTCGKGTRHAILLATPGDLAMCQICAAEGYPVVYRCYGTGGSLLYIGCTGNFARREVSHRSSAPWWPQVAEIRKHYFPILPEALAAERIAIFEENPPMNAMTRQRVVDIRNGFAPRVAWSAA